MKSFSRLYSLDVAKGNEFKMGGMMPWTNGEHFLSGTKWPFMIRKDDSTTVTKKNI